MILVMRAAPQLGLAQLFKIIQIVAGLKINSQGVYIII